MNKNKTSITVRLRKSQKKETRRDFAHAWADGWEQKYVELINELQQAIKNGASSDELREIFGDLRGLQQPHFSALHNVIDELIDPTRELI